MSGLKKIFIDGEAGTTGLQVRERLAQHKNIHLLSIAEADRKNPDIRRKFLNDADIVILCLPDEAAKQAVQLIDNPNTAVIDASTAHRIDPDWTYGFAEMTPGHEKIIANSKRVSNPGCYPTGAIALTRPLIESGLLPKAHCLKVNGVSGYSGGGKALIALHQNHDIEPYGSYALSLQHKHVPEMQHYGLLQKPPLFTPSVGHFAQGMLVSIPLFTEELTQPASLEDIQEIYQTHYKGCQFINVAPANATSHLERDAFLRPDSLNDTNGMDIFVHGHNSVNKSGQILLIARLDNLGKGASGAAVQNMNILLGLKADTGL